MAQIIGQCSIPSNAYSIWDIAKIERINESVIRKLMRETLVATERASNNKSVSGIVNYFNSMGYEDGFINRFMTHWSLQPFAQAIKMVSESSIRSSKKGIQNVTYISFYVSKSVYERWKKRNVAYKPTMRKEQKYDVNTKVKRRQVSLPRGRIVKHFESVIKQLGFTMPEAVLMALDFYMKQHKDVFGEIDEEIDESLISDNYTSLVFGYIDKNVVNKMWKVIHRHNAINTPSINLSEFIESAIVEKLDRTPLKYVNPKLHEELQALEKAEIEALEALKRSDEFE